MGTHKVIHEHATIGMLVTTDGTIGEIGRASYIEAEERIVGELKAIGKPFAVILNTADPTAESAIKLAYELEERYDVPVALVNCLQLSGEDIRHILEMVLHEFPVCEVSLRLPAWTATLDPMHRIRQSLDATIRACAKDVRRAGDVAAAFGRVTDVFAKSDRILVNLECALTDSEHKIIKKGPNLKGPKATAATLKKAGVTDCMLSNNHIFDFGVEGLVDTLEQLDAAGLAWTGVGNDYEDSRRDHTMIIDGITAVTE